MGRRIDTKFPPVAPKKSYRKPMFRRGRGLDFILEKIRTEGVSCRQCSSCHGCR